MSGEDLPSDINRLRAERNKFARQLADYRDEADTAKRERDAALVEKARYLNEVVAVQVNLADMTIERDALRGKVERVEQVVGKFNGRARAPHLMSNVRQAYNKAAQELARALEGTT